MRWDFERRAKERARQDDGLVMQGSAARPPDMARSQDLENVAKEIVEQTETEARHMCQAIVPFRAMRSAPCRQVAQQTGAKRGRRCNVM